MTIKDTCDQIKASGNLGDDFKKPKTVKSALEALASTDYKLTSLRAFLNSEGSSKVPVGWGRARVKMAYMVNQRMFLLDFIRRNT